jgi:hypothetical protein
MISLSHTPHIPTHPPPASAQVVGLTEHATRDPRVVQELLARASASRSIGTTKVNADSSRSHSVLQLLVREGGGGRLVGKANLVDLAGSEKAAESAPPDAQTHLEAAEINKSLLALKECIRAMGKGQAKARLAEQAKAMPRSRSGAPSSSGAPHPLSLVRQSLDGHLLSKAAHAASAPHRRRRSMPGPGTGEPVSSAGPSSGDEMYDGGAGSDSDAGLEYRVSMHRRGFGDDDDDEGDGEEEDVDDYEDGYGSEGPVMDVDAIDARILAARRGASVGGARGRNGTGSGKPPRRPGTSSSASASRGRRPGHKALAKQHTHIPFRGSKLTQILRDCFTSPGAVTVMIATLSPGHVAADHTLNTLRYADRLKEIGRNTGTGPAGAGAGVASIASSASATGVVTGILADNTAGLRVGVLWNREGKEEWPGTVKPRNFDPLALGPWQQPPPPPPATTNQMPARETAPPAVQARHETAVVDSTGSAAGNATGATATAGRGLIGRTTAARPKTPADASSMPNRSRSAAPPPLPASHAPTSSSSSAAFSTLLASAVGSPPRTRTVTGTSAATAPGPSASSPGSTSGGQAQIVALLDAQIRELTTLRDRMADAQAAKTAGGGKGGPPAAPSSPPPQAARQPASAQTVTVSAPTRAASPPKAPSASAQRLSASSKQAKAGTGPAPGGGRASLGPSSSAAASARAAGAKERPAAKPRQPWASVVEAGADDADVKAAQKVASRGSDAPVWMVSPGKARSPVRVLVADEGATAEFRASMALASKRAVETAAALARGDAPPAKGAARRPASSSPRQPSTASQEKPDTKAKQQGASGSGRVAASSPRARPESDPAAGDALSHSPVGAGPGGHGILSMPVASAPVSRTGHGPAPALARPATAAGPRLASPRVEVHAARESSVTVRPVTAAASNAPRPASRGSQKAAASSTPSSSASGPSPYAQPLVALFNKARRASRTSEGSGGSRATSTGAPQTSAKAVAPAPGLPSWLPSPAERRQGHGLSAGTGEPDDAGAARALHRAVEGLFRTQLAATHKRPAADDSDLASPPRPPVLSGQRASGAPFSMSLHAPRGALFTLDPALLEAIPNASTNPPVRSSPVKAVSSKPRADKERDRLFLGSDSPSPSDADADTDADIRRGAVKREALSPTSAIQLVRAAKVADSPPISPVSLLNGLHRGTSSSASSFSAVPVPSRKDMAAASLAIHVGGGNGSRTSAAAITVMPLSATRADALTAGKGARSHDVGVAKIRRSLAGQPAASRPRV